MPRPAASSPLGERVARAKPDQDKEDSGVGGRASFALLP